MADLFSLSATTPSGGMVHGDATARGEAQASALLRRGIDLRAGFDLAASLRAAIGEGLAARVAAGVGVQAGIALQAAIPLDLFGEAGVVARFQAQAAAAAWVSATLSLEPEVFRAKAKALVPAPLDELVDVFLDEVQFSAGLWGRAAFAAEIRGEAVLTGSIVPRPGRDAGFSFALRYAAGLAYGAGKEFVANVAIPDPVRLLDRLGDRMVAIVVREAEQALAGQPAETRAAALAGLRVALGLGTRAAFRAGLGLATGDGARRQAAATAGLVDALAQSAQAELLRALGALAAHRLAGLLDPASALGALMADPAKRQPVRDELVALHDRLVELDAIPTADAAAWLAGVVAALGPLGRLLDLGLADASAAQARHALALLWTAATLLERVASWYDDPSRAASELFGDGQVTAPEAGGLAAVVAEAAGRPAGAGLRLRDLLAFLLGAGPLIDDLRTLAPGLAAALDTIETLTGSAAGQAVQELLVELAKPGPDTVSRVLERLATSIGPLVRDELVVKVLGPVKAAHPGDAGLTRLVDELVTPVLLGLPAVLLPNLAGTASDEAALRLREALSAVLLQPLALAALAGIDVLLEHALREGQAALRAAATAVQQAGEAWGGLGALLLLALEAPLPVHVTATEARILLELAATIAGSVNQYQRVPVMDALRALTRLGLESAAGPETSLTGLLASSDPPDRARLDAALVQVRDGSWEVVKLVAPTALALLAAHYLGVIVEVAAAVATTAKALVEAARRGLEAIGEALGELVERLRLLAGRALALLGQFAGQVKALAERAATLVSTVVERIRAAGLALFQPLLGALPSWAAKALVDLYNSLFDAARSLLTAPLNLLADLAGLVEDACNALVHLDLAALRQEVRRRILANAALEVHFDLALWVDPPEVLGLDPPPFKAFDLGRVTISAGAVLGAMADVVLGDPVVSQRLAEASARQGELRAVQAEEAAVETLKAGAEAQQKAQADAARLVPGLPLRVRFLAPADQAVELGLAGVRIHIDGANATFVRATLGVQPRVAVRVNGRPWHYDAASWTEGPSGIEVAFCVVPLPDPAPQPPAASGVPIRIEQPTGVLASLERAGDGQLQLAFSVPDPHPVAVPGPPGPLGPARVLVERVPATRVPGGLAAVLRAAGPALAAGGGEPGPAGMLRGAGQASVSLRQPPAGVSLSGSQAQAEAAAVGLGIDPYGTPLLAGRLGLNAVQVAVADGAGLEAAGRLLCFIAPDPRKLTIVEVAAGPPDPQGQPDESVAIHNDGPVDVDLTGWTIGRPGHDTYEFPPFVLAPGGTVRVWTGLGPDTATDLHWDRQEPAWWSERGGTAVLTEPTGRVMARLDYAWRPR